MTLEEIMAVPTVLSQAELDRDVWDDVNRVAYSADGKYLIMTSQGRSGNGGNAVDLFEVTYK